MTIDDARATVRQIPRPRRPEEAPTSWQEPEVARPRTDYWDVTTASWRSRGPVAPRSGD